MKNTLFLAVFAAIFATNVINAENKIAFITTAASLSDLQTNGDDDEAAAANWFATEYPSPTGTILSTQDAGNWDLNQYTAVWIAIDRVGIGDGLPSELTDASVLNKVKSYYQAGGNLLLTNHATRYLVNLERTTRFPGIKGDGAGSDNAEAWGVNTIIGSSYDHSADFLYDGMTLDLIDGTSKKVYNLIGSGWKEDHNSMWDLNVFQYNGTPNIVVNFETENNATVLATWQQVIDYCCAGIVDFHATGSYGECIAIGVAAYEWNQNSGTNPYQANIQGLTKNALDELCGKWRGENADKVAFVHLPASIDGLTDDDERTAAEWFVHCYGGDYLPLANVNASTLANYNAIWLMWDKDGTGTPANSLPSEYWGENNVVFNAIKAWYKAGGNLFLTNYATQYLYNDLGRMPVNDAVYSRAYALDNTEGSNGSIQTFFGKDAVSQTFNYSLDPLFAGLSNPVSVSFNGVENCYTIPLLDNTKPMEKHNCFWHSDMVSWHNTNTGKYAAMYEALHVTPLATRDGIGDYYGAGIARWDAIDFGGDENFQGKAITIGLGTYEWNQTSNPYTNNIRRLTFNALNELNIKTVLNVSSAYEINSGNKYKNIIIQPDGKLTLANGISIEAETITLKSDETGRGTFVNSGTANITTANVEQYLSTDNSREWYYLASPVTGATSALFGTSNWTGNYTEATTSYSNPFTSETTLEVGRGYAVKLIEASNPTYTFSGTLNDGAINIPVTRTGDAAPKRGFNLVGNPYPSYLDWDLASASANVQSTIWTRTFESGAMVFKTYNAAAGLGADDQTTAHIAPLQAFWVKVVDANTEADENVTLNLTNAMRLHKGDGDGILRAAKVETRELLRLQVSNGTNADNAVILFDENAQDAFDSYDSEKMSNDNAAIPEIYTLAGDEKVAINSLTGAAANREIALGFKTGTAGSFIISAITMDNIADLTLIDNVAVGEYDLKAGNYTFTSDATNNADRFTLAFRAPQTPTGIDNAPISTFRAWAEDNRIVINADKDFTVFNSLGQQVKNHRAPAGIYIVKCENKTAKVIVK